MVIKKVCDVVTSRDDWETFRELLSKAAVHINAGHRLEYMWCYKCEHTWPTFAYGHIHGPTFCRFCEACGSNRISRTSSTGFVYMLMGKREEQLCALTGEDRETAHKRIIDYIREMPEGAQSFDDAAKALIAQAKARIDIINAIGGEQP